MKRHYLSALTFAAALFTVVSANAQAQERKVPFGFGPGLSSEELAKLPQTPGATGDQERHYYFKEAKMEMPYHLFVPKSYDPKVPTPFIVALHGFTGNHDYFFALTDDLPGQLEKHGFILVAPMGYNTGSWYGRGGPAKFGGDESTADIYPEGSKLSVTELGELDVNNVIAMVQKEYNTDPNRTYLMGHSMGGAGTWYMGKKYANKWAAIAPMSGLIRSGIDAEAYKNIPVMAAVGGEEKGQLEGTQNAVKAIKAAGGTAEYLEIPGAGHVPMIRPAVPQILDFFAKYRKGE